MKKGYLRAVCVCLIGMLLMAAAVYASEGQPGAAGTDATPYHVIMLIDNTGSMHGTDPDKMSLSAAKQFVTQLCSTNSRSAAVTSVGVMTFALDTVEVSPMVTLDSEKNQSDLCEKIDAIAYLPSGTGGTDPYTAVYNAAVTLKANETPDCKNMIVLLTDGEPAAIADQNASLQKLEDAFGICADLDCQIYAVGVNPKGNIKEVGQQEIFRIADTAQTEEGFAEPDARDAFASFDKVNYIIAGDMYDVSQFYVNVFANMFHLEGELFEGTFDVPAGGVVEADVIVFSASQIRSVESIAPDGTKMAENGSSYTITGDDNYKVVKIQDPQPGTWSVNVYTEDTGYKTYVVRMYGVDIVMDASWGRASDFAGCPLTEGYAGRVELKPMYRNQPYGDDTFASTVRKAEISYSNTDTGASGTQSAVYDNTTGTFIGYFPVEKGSYTIDAVFETDAVQKELSAAFNAEIVPEKMDLGDISVMTGQETSIDLNAQGAAQGMTISAMNMEGSGGTSAQDLAELSFRDSTVTLTGRKAGSFQLVGAAVDGEGTDYEITGTVKVEKSVIDLGKISVLTGKDTTISLDDKSGIQGMTVDSVSARGSGTSAPEDLAEFSAQDSEVRMTGKKEGRFQLTGTVSDSEGTEYDFTGSVEVKRYIPPYYYMIAAAALLALILAGIFLANKLAVLPGNFTLRLTNQDTGTSEEIKLPDHPKGKTITLWKLVNIAIGMWQAEERSARANDELIRLAQAQRGALAKEKIALRKDSRTNKKNYFHMSRNGPAGLASFKNCFASRSSGGSGRLQVEVMFEPLGGGFDENFGAQPTGAAGGAAPAGGRRPSGQNNSQPFDDGWGQ